MQLNNTQQHRFNGTSLQVVRLYRDVQNQLFCILLIGNLTIDKTKSEHLFTNRRNNKFDVKGSVSFCEMGLPCESKFRFITHAGKLQTPNSFTEIHSMDIYHDRCSVKWE